MREVCFVCEATMQPLFRLQVLNKYDAQYFHCPECGYARTEEPYWLDEAYASAIAASDTGILQRNLSLSAKLACVLYYCLDHRGTYLDIAGGYGILTRLMRDYGFDYYWDDKYCANLMARGFESADARSQFSALSGFEVIEHAVDPVQFISETMAAYKCRTLVLSTITYAGEKPAPNWFYLTPVTGQHISFFQRRTLARIAQRLGLRLYSSGGLHLFSDQPLRNTWLYPLLSSPFAWMWAQYVRLRLGSLAESDHARMLAQQSLVSNLNAPR